MRQVRRQPAGRSAVLPEMREAGKLATEISRRRGSAPSRDPSAETQAAHLSGDIACSSGGRHFVGWVERQSERATGAGICRLETRSDYSRRSFFHRSAHLSLLQICVARRLGECTIVGQFSSFADSSNIGNRRDTTRSKNSENEDVDNNIEVYVLTDSAFTVWQHGYATSSVYESGKVSEGSVQADVPAGAGIYYLVFSNKAAPKAAKNVHAAVLLRYKSWLPEWFRRMKGRVLDWVGAA